jgi:hypothetical protein
LLELHARVCRGHIGARALAAKVLQQGFYWPAMIDDTAKLVSTYEACQRFSRKTKAPMQSVQLIDPSWPLQRWGINIVGKLTLAQGNYTYAVVAVEYFTKWIEAKRIGPYVASEKTRSGVYRLSNTQGRVLEHSWNTENLCRFYI